MGSLAPRAGACRARWSPPEGTIAPNGLQLRYCSTGRRTIILIVVRRPSSVELLDGRFSRTPAHSRGFPAVPGDLPSEWRNRLEEALRSLQNSLESEHTRRAYRDEWRRWCTWIGSQGIHPISAQPLHVHRYMEHLYTTKKAKATRARALTIVRSVYSAIVVSGLMPINPAREVKNIRVASDPRTPWLSAEELKRLLVYPSSDASWIERRDWLITHTLVGTGLRRAEIARMRREHLIAAPDGYRVKVRAKRSKDGTTTLPVWLSQFIDEWCEENSIASGPLFRRVGSTSGLSPSRIYWAVKFTAIRTGVDKNRSTPHSLRRTLTTIAKDRGVPMQDIQYQLMHEHGSTTERYYRGTALPANSPGEVLADLIGRKP